MTRYVLIENKPEGKYTASLIGWPEVKAQGGTEDEALSHLRRSLSTHLTQAKIVPLELTVDQPWLQTAGMFKDDLFADELQEVIAAYRRERDAHDALPDTQDQAA
jgi:predicted RNase H-like HicB family nuclease